jgi:S-adenosylmethionine hydrolase
MPILTLTTDFGLDDYYVAAVKGVVLGLAPAAHLVDVSHPIPPGDLEWAGFVLAAAAEERACRPARRITLFASHYAEIPAGVPALIEGSCGTLEASLRGESLARLWSVERGDKICIRWETQSGAERSAFAQLRGTAL